MRTPTCLWDLQQLIENLYGLKPESFEGITLQYKDIYIRMKSRENEWMFQKGHERKIYQIQGITKDLKKIVQKLKNNQL